MVTVDYFAYGANLNPAVLQRREFAYIRREPAVLLGCALKFNKRASRSGLPAGVGFANVVEKTGASVEGVLYTVTREDLLRLDEHERAPEHYRRQRTVVETSVGSRHCEVYRAHPDRIADDLVPTRNYLNHLLAAKNLLSRDYWRALSIQQCYRAACASCSELTEVLFTEAGGSNRAECAVCGETPALA